MGVPDDVKLRACMTLFLHAERSGESKESWEWQAVLDTYFEGREHVETGFLLEVYGEGRVPA